MKVHRAHDIEMCRSELPSLQAIRVLSRAASQESHTMRQSSDDAGRSSTLQIFNTHRFSIRGCLLQVGATEQLSLSLGCALIKAFRQRHHKRNGELDAIRE